ncbi:hypothetical protein HDU67_006804 [Dinochytrium kinnereticum]|nr:hypothetical protein HDU67_006804 [Dinochytrium kinnereticum]
MDPYLSAISRADFQLDAFLTELLLHTFQPFVVLLTFNPKIRTICRNRHFIIGEKLPITIAQALIMACLILVNSIIVFLDDRTYTYFQLAIFNISTLLRYLVIALKYAYMSPLEYAETLTNSRLSAEAGSRRQLIAGWNVPESSLRDVQLLLSSVRQQCCLLSFYFNVGEHDVIEKPFASTTESSTDAEKAVDITDKASVDLYTALRSEARERYAEYQPEQFIVPQTGSIVVPSSQASDQAFSNPNAISKTNAFADVYVSETASRSAKNSSLEAQPLAPLFPLAPTVMPPLVEESEKPVDDAKNIEEGLPSPPILNTYVFNTDSGLIKLWDVATGIIDESMSLSTNTSWMYLLGLLHSAIPLLSFTIDYSYGLVKRAQLKTPLNRITVQIPPIEWTPRTIAVTFFLHIFSFMIGITVMTHHFGFLLVGISDFRRREYFQRRLSAIINDGYVRIRKGDSDEYEVYLVVLVGIALLQSYVLKRAVETSIFGYVILHSISLCGLIDIMV